MLEYKSKESQDKLARSQTIVPWLARMPDSRTEDKYNLNIPFKKKHSNPVTNRGNRGGARFEPYISTLMVETWYQLF